MSYNTFGRVLRLTSWGESHGEQIGCVLDGVPPRLALSEADIQPFLDKRRPGQSKYTTQRREADEVRILSGVFEGLTTGTPLSMVIANTDVRSRDYDEIAGRYRPAHADYTYDAKYGVRDYRGGGRSSARETALRVAAGAVAEKILRDRLSGDIKIRAALVEMGGRGVSGEAWDWDEVERNSFFCPDVEMAVEWGEYLDSVRKSGDSLGSIVEVHAEGFGSGLGAPLYGKLDADLAAAMMSIPAVKGVEIGAGFEAARLRGSENADEMRVGKGGEIEFTSNHAGGILGGISSGQDIIVRFAVKPTSSILMPKRTITKDGQNTTITTKGRHDPCVGIRAVPIGAAMMALTLADHWLLHRAQCL